MAELTLRIITPERIAHDGTVSAVRIPALDGSMGILPRHAPMVAGLAEGELRYRDGKGEQSMFVSGGFAEVRDNTVRIVSEAGERPDEINEDRARAAEKRARERLAVVAGRGDAVDSLRAEAALRRAMMRLRVKGGRR